MREQPVNRFLNLERLWLFFRMLLTFSEQTKGQKFPDNASDQEMLEIVMARYGFFHLNWLIKVLIYLLSLLFLVFLIKFALSSIRLWDIKLSSEAFLCCWVHGMLLYICFVFMVICTYIIFLSIHSQEHTHVRLNTLCFCVVLLKVCLSSSLGLLYKVYC